MVKAGHYIAKLCNAVGDRAHPEFVSCAHGLRQTALMLPAARAGGAMLDTVSAPCCRGLSQGRLPQDAVQCLDVALKQPALFHPRVRTLPHAFFLEDPASAIGLGGPSEVSTVVRQPLKVLKGLRCATAAASRGAV